MCTSIRSTSRLSSWGTVEIGRLCIICPPLVRALWCTNNLYCSSSFISVTEYLNYEGGKFSKSKNRGVFGPAAKETGIPASVWRYYLLSTRPETADAMFSWADCVSANMYLLHHNNPCRHIQIPANKSVFLNKSVF